MMQAAHQHMFFWLHAEEGTSFQVEGLMDGPLDLALFLLSPGRVIHVAQVDQWQLQGSVRLYHLPGDAPPGWENGAQALLPLRDQAEALFQDMRLQRPAQPQEQRNH